MMTKHSQFTATLVRPGRMPASRRTGKRRGVILLLIMGMLAMFGLVAIAFVLNAGQFRRSARVLSRVGQKTDPANLTLDQAVRQVIRGSNSEQSVFSRPICLLEDIYGNESVQGSISDMRMTPSVPQLFEVKVGAARPEAFVGCVLTMTNGPAAGRSTHIVGLSSDGYLQMVVYGDGVFPATGNTCLINGTPFSGTGVGYNPATGRLDATVGNGWEIALLPNLPLSQYGVRSQPSQPAGPTNPINPPGGANEDYDAADFQNPLLGALITTPNGDGTMTTRVMPSLHRPDLMAYWSQRMGGNISPDLMRLILMRPNGTDHPKFWGSVNGQFSNGVLDVDNDGDGIADSIWVDLGMPVRAAKDGRLYKPLFAILCVDMDGKLNLNAHGDLAQCSQNYYQGVNISEVPNGTSFAGGGTSASLPRGQGWGPAEINLMPLFDGNYNYFNQLLTGIPSTLDGRYGDTGTGTPMAGYPTAAADPAANPLGSNLLFEYNGNFWDFATPGGFGSPPDIFGTGAVGLDPAGRPLFASMGMQSDFAENPYKINLSSDVPRGMPTLTSPPQNYVMPPDNPFSPTELERLLRPYDRDAATLPNRLWNLTQDGNGISYLLPRRNMITTDSWDLPCPGLAMPKAMRDALRTARSDAPFPQHVTDLLVARMGSSATAAVMHTLLPPEMLAGLRMDINRPFGNGKDDNNNGVVDEDEEKASDMVTVYPSGTQVKFNHLNTDNAAAFGTYTDRELHARYLYVLAMLLSGDELKAQLGPEDACRMLAQWAVNVVDFRDRDSIMTKFAYTIDPFTSAGWNPTGDAAHTVWGCERPELLMTETLAFHDRRTENLDTDDGTTRDQKGSFSPRTPPDPDNEKDATYDQKMRPIGSLFIELYNPNSPLTPAAGEFTRGDLQSGVSLVKRVNDTGDPVWRMIICRKDGGVRQRDPDDPTLGPISVERSIYFVQPTGALGSDGVRYYPSTDMGGVKIAPVLPGRYMVVGPGDLAAGVGDKNTTYIGEKDNNTRRIELVPGAAGTAKVVLHKTGSTAEDHLASVAVINTPHRLSVSEPTDGYPANDSEGGAYKNETGYPKPYDKPFDIDPDKNKMLDDPDDKDALEKTGTTNGYRVVHLQRLADPTKAWNATTNPYRTVDSMPIDLTAYNGISDKQDEPGFGAPTAVDFTSRERGTAEAQEGVLLDLWKQERWLPKSPSLGQKKTPTGSEKFKNAWALSLGYLNEAFGPPNEGGAVPGDPAEPFPWLTWNNRPYMSQLELLLVPALRSSQLLACADGSAEGKFGFDIPKQGVPANVYDSAAWRNMGNRCYPHLMPMLDSGPSGNAAAGGSAQLYRILDYLNVPSRFAGAQLQGNPQTFASGDHAFHPPFNKIPTYREPGRININTIYNEEVLDGLANYANVSANPFPYGDGNSQTFLAKLTRSRRGDGGSDILAPNGAIPSVFAHPFRTFAGGELVPIDALRPTREINATILREDPDDPTRPLFSKSSTSAYNDTNRNPYFRYEGAMRLGNLVTTRSNVYAIWITMGYFEVTPWGSVDTQHPDGFQLGGELGADTGESNRHRAFYIFDRSIPVGFQRGVDNNIDKGILVRRFIE